MTSSEAETMDRLRAEVREARAVTLRHKAEITVLRGRIRALAKVVRTISSRIADIAYRAESLNPGDGCGAVGRILTDCQAADKAARASRLSTVRID